MVKLSKYYRRLIIVLVIINIAFATLFLTKRAGAGNVVSVVGAIEVYDSDGISPLTSYDFPLFIGGIADTFLKNLFVNNTGNQPVYVCWNISTSSIAWEARTPNLDAYDHYEDDTRKYGFAIRQDFSTPTDYWHPNREAIFLGVSEGIKLRLELHYTGEPNTAETFTMTISFYACMLESAIEELMETIGTSDLPKGTKNSLTPKLDDAVHLLDKGNENGAIHKLMDFIDQAEGLRGKKLTDEQADQLIAEAQRIIDLINGQTP
jgi:hypothetical protein